MSLGNGCRLVSVYLILVPNCAGPRCAYVSEHSWFVWVVAFGVCSVFVGASVCAVLLGVAALAMSCSRFCLVLGFVRDLSSSYNVRLGLAVLVSVIARCGSGSLLRRFNISYIYRTLS